MFKLHLYTVSSEVNRVDKSSELSEDFTLEGTLKDDCSIVDPSIVVAADANIVRFNYAYVVEFNRYYFINDIVALNNGMWTLSMHVDVLMSFKDQFLKLSAFVSRNEKEYDPLLVDDRFPIQGATERTKIADLKNPFKPLEYQTECILLVLSSNVLGRVKVTVGPHVGEEALGGWGISNVGKNEIVNSVHSPSRGNGIFCLLCKDTTVVNVLLTATLETIVRDSILGIYNVIAPDFEIMNWLNGVDYVELSKNTQLALLSSSIKLGADAEYSADVILADNCYQVGYATTFVMSRRDGSTKGIIILPTKSFLDYPPYCRYYVALPFVGRFEIDSKFFDRSKSEQQLKVTAFFDFTQAKIGYVIQINDAVVEVKEGTFGSRLPYQSTNLPELQAAKQSIAIKTLSNVTTGIAAALSTAVLVGTVGNGNPAIIAGALASGVFSATGAAAEKEAEERRLVPELTTGKPDSDYLSLGLSDAYVEAIRCGSLIGISDAHYLSLNGKPLRVTKKVNELHGYTEIHSIHLDDVYATAGEKGELDAKLKSGVILP